VAPSSRRWHCGVGRNRPDGIIPLLIDTEITKLLGTEDPAVKAEGCPQEDIEGAARAQRKPAM
jgi:hypothetical protein